MVLNESLRGKEKDKVEATKTRITCTTGKREHNWKVLMAARPVTTLSYLLPLHSKFQIFIFFIFSFWFSSQSQISSQSHRLASQNNAVKASIFISDSTYGNTFVDCLWFMT